VQFLHTLFRNVLSELLFRSNPSSAQRRSDVLCGSTVYDTISMGRVTQGDRAKLAELPRLHARKNARRASVTGRASWLNAR
jgi:hypothetical protein